VFVEGAVLLAPLLSSFADAGVVHWLRGEPYWLVWRNRLMANVLAQLTIVPALVGIIVHFRESVRGVPIARWVEGTLLCTLLLVAGVFLVSQPVHDPTLVAVFSEAPFALLLPFVLWGALRFGSAGASLTLLVTTLLTSWAVAHGHGPFRDLPPRTTILAVQVLLVFVGVTFITLATIIDERRVTAQALTERLRFEELLARVSAAFVEPASDRLAVAFDTWLERLGRFIGVDCLRLFYLSADRDNLEIAAAWLAPGLKPPASPDIKRDFPWVLKHVLSQRPAIIDDARRLPADASTDRASFEAQGLEAALVIPMVAANRVHGALAFGTVGPHEWPEKLVTPLHLVADVFANAVARKQAEEALRDSERDAERSRRELAHVTRVSTMGALTVALAHQLNQPLAAIMSNAQAARRILAKSPAELTEIDEILSDIVSDDRRASDVIRNVRTLLHKGDAAVAPVDLVAVVRDTAALVTSDALIRSVILSLDLPAAPLMVHADAIQLQQVVLNLILNALEALDESSNGNRRIVVRCGQRDDRSGQVLIRDSGPGFSSAAQAQLFEPFFTTKASGTGMGLSIARSIVDAHGGTIRAYNADTGGAIVEFDIPLDGA
jgi:signal transduction histidine kinase